MKTKMTLVFLFTLSILSAQPQLDWSRTMNGGNNLVEKASKILVDGCDVYVTGTSDSIGQGTDIVTIKYDLDGNVLWRHRWDGADHFNDSPTDMVIDASGNVYVCGKTEGQLTGMDWVVLKYDASGSMQAPWPVTYNGPNNNADEPMSISVNNTSGDVYVCGYSTNAQSAFSLQDSKIIRYRSNGTVANEVISNGGNQNEFGKRIKVDNSGVIWLAEFMNMGPWGNVMNTKRYTTPDLSSFTFDGGNSPGLNDFPDFLFHQGNVFLGYTFAQPTQGFHLRKNGSNNLNLWNKTYQFAGTSDHSLKSTCLSNSGNIFAAASVTNANGDQDMWLLHIDGSTGDTLWTRTWDGGNFDYDVPVKVLFVSNPAAFVIIGNTINASGQNEIVILKYDLAGTLQTSYTTLFDAAAQFDNVSIDATQDINSNIYIGGQSGNAGSEDFLTLKYATNSYSISVINVMGDSLAVVPGAMAYQWYRNDTLLAGETNQGIALDTSIHYLANYHCDVLQYCAWYTSDSLPFTVGIQDVVKDSRITFFPNPTREHIFLCSQKDIVNGGIKILSQIGRVVYEESGITMNAHEARQIPFALPSGYYFIEFSEGHEMRILEKLMIQ